MTSIITITSGLPHTGKSELALNLALERVRRGGWTGVFHDRNEDPGIGGLIRLPAAVFHERRTGDTQPSDILRRGYQGVDILGCRLPLGSWPVVDPLRRHRCRRELDTPDGYDLLLVDTSGMAEHATLACCLASPMVVLLVTPSSASRAAAFGLLRVLLQNGYQGQLRLLVNRATEAVEAREIHDQFSTQAREHLGVDIPLLGFLGEDPHVDRARQAGQAFSSVFPDAEATAQIVVLTDAIEEIEQTVLQPLAVVDYWERVEGLLTTPVALPGGATLDPVRSAAEGPATDGSVTGPAG